MTNSLQLMRCLLIVGKLGSIWLGQLLVASSSPAPIEWPEYHADGYGSHYSNAAQINVSNVANLKVAWSYSSGGADLATHRSQIQCNPIVVKGRLYGVSADSQVFCVDARTGREIWRSSVAGSEGAISRGVAYWEDDDNRIILYGANRWLNALNADDGRPVTTFGNGGQIDLKIGIDRPGGDDSVQATTPGTVFKDVIIVGVRVSEGDSALLGDIRAFNIRTGKLVWTFRTIPAEGDEGYTTWSSGSPRSRFGGANAWAGMSIDRKRGIVYVPTGSAAYDFFGGDRKGDNLFANCLIALDASNGRKLWHHQLVRHDLWDRDLPAPPNLLTVTHEGKAVDAVAQVTKQGTVFLFDRVHGTPLFPIDEIEVRTDGVPGEAPSVTQPFPRLPLPFTRQSFSFKDVNPWSSDFKNLVREVKESRTGTPYIPLTEQRTVIYPGTDGGAQWGGAAVDPAGFIYIPAKEVPVYSTLVKRVSRRDARRTFGSEIFAAKCATCHGVERSGSHDGTLPSLIGIEKRHTANTIQTIVEKGRGLMPGFSNLSPEEVSAVVNFVLGRETSIAVASDSVIDSPFRHTGYNRWFDKDGYPINAPPWGTLTAINLNTGSTQWQIALGEYPELSAKGIPDTGTDNFGGPLVTAGGLLFIAATKDEMFRAIKSDTGEVLWKFKLPAAGFASPTTYVVDGVQYVTIACGGGKLNAKSSDIYLTFSL